MYSYFAFGINISSEIELPTLQVSHDTEADVTIRIGKIDVEKRELADSIGYYAQCLEKEYWFTMPDIAHFHIRDGKYVTVEPLEKADDKSIQLFLLGSTIAAIMHQRNQLVLHGNAIRVGDKCVIFAGKSGHGKSTLSAALYKRGYQILTDDVAVINNQSEVEPSYPQLKLWKDTADKLGIDTQSLSCIRDQIEKYAIPLRDSFHSKPLPVAAVYILHPHYQKTIEITEAKGAHKFLPLKNNTFRSKMIKGFKMEKEHLSLCSQLANQIKLKHVHRPREGFSLDELVTTLEDDFATLET